MQCRWQDPFSSWSAKRKFWQQPVEKNWSCQVASWVSLDQKSGEIIGPPSLARVKSKHFLCSSPKCPSLLPVRVVLWWPTTEKNSFKKSTNVSYILLHSQNLFFNSQSYQFDGYILSFVKKLHNSKSTNLALFSLFFYAYYEELSEFRSGIPSDLKKITYIQQ